ncbi:GIDE domain-containing protein [Halorubrum cibi]|uniref:RING-type E3 ubiquitin transferase n=1 Tax=Halorubrum cibi TaxID=413815 RepID=A0A521C376_9EURY|nr:GIDE domain-containing protein [Halorubrum cibi]SMO53261.1 E3 Ubiquitin ligase [Halorubrum cibi]
MLALAGVAALVGVYLVVWGVNGIRRTIAVWASDPIPIEEARLADGTIEIEGTAEPLSGTLQSPYDEAECLAYSYSKKREKRERNEDGEYETEWRTVDSGGDSVPFLVSDDTGSIPVDPAAATLGLDTEYSSHVGDVKKTESRIDPGDGVHVIGQKVPAVETDVDLGDERAYVGDGEETPTFRITNGGELETVARMFGRSAGSIALGGTLIAAFGYLLLTSVPGIAA